MSHKKWKVIKYEDTGRTFGFVCGVCGLILPLTTISRKVAIHIHHDPEADELLGILISNELDKHLPECKKRPTKMWTNSWLWNR